MSAATTIPNERLRRPLVMVCIAVTVLGCALYYGTGPGLAGTVWELTIGLLLVLMAVGSGMFQQTRLPWIAIWVGLTSAFVGGLMAAHPSLAPFDVTSPSIVDALKLANYPLGAAGVLFLVWRADRRIGLRASLEAIILIGAGVTVIWMAVLRPLVASTAFDNSAGIVALLYPLMDILLLAVLIAAISHLDHRPGPMLLVVAALGGNLAADVAMGAQSLRGGFRPGTLIDLGWLVCFAAFALAPLWRVSDKPSLVADEGRLGPVRLGLLLAGAVLVPAIAAGDALAGNRPPAILLISGVALSGLSLVRLMIFNKDLARERERTELLAAKLLDRNSDLQRARIEQRQLLSQVHKLVEQERIKIAADIHDGPLQKLVGVGYQLERLAMMVERGDSDGASGLADDAADELTRQLGVLRELMTEVRPPVLDESGILGALRDRASKLMEDAGDKPISVLVEGSVERLPADLETALFRISQEALQNVIRHANATEVRVTVRCDGTMASLECADNGIGLDTTRLHLLSSEGHFGITGMRERIELIGGTMTVTSSKAGTTVRVSAPTTPNEESQRFAPHLKETEEAMV